MIYSKIKNELHKRKLSIKEFVEKEVGITEAGFHKAVRNHTLKIRDLEKISEALGVSMSYWWADDDNQINEQGARYEKTGSMEFNAQLLSPKDEVIKAQGGTIAALNDLNNQLKKQLQKYEGECSEQRAFLRIMHTSPNILVREMEKSQMILRRSY